MIWDKTKTIVSECKTILDRIKTLYTSYAAKLPENVAKAVHNGQQRYNLSQQIVAVEDKVPDISNKQLVTISENYRLLSNTLDFVQQAIRKCEVETCCIVQYHVLVYDICLNNIKYRHTKTISVLILHHFKNIFFIHFRRSKGKRKKGS